MTPLTPPRPPAAQSSQRSPVAACCRARSPSPAPPRSSARPRSPSRRPRVGRALAAPADAVLVVLSLRGAADGLSLVVPHADPAYYAARPRIAIPADRLLAKDGMFGLHPELAPLLPLWTAGSTRRRPRHRAARTQPVPLRRHGGGRGRRPRLVGPQRLAQPAHRYGAGAVPAAGLQHRRRRRRRRRSTVPSRRCRPETSTACASPARTSDDHGGRRQSLHTMWDERPLAGGQGDALDVRRSRRRSLPRRLPPTTASATRRPTSARRSRRSPRHPRQHRRRGDHRRPG